MSIRLARTAALLGACALWGACSKSDNKADSAAAADSAAKAAAAAAPATPTPPPLTDANIAAILRNQTIKTRPRNEVHDLRKQRSAKVHDGTPDRKNRENYRETPIRVQIDTK